MKLPLDLEKLKKHLEAIKYAHDMLNNDLLIRAQLTQSTSDAKAIKDKISQLDELGECLTTVYNTLYTSRELTLTKVATKGLVWPSIGN